MVNLIAGRQVVPELIQDDFTAERVAEEAGRFLENSHEGRARSLKMREELAGVRRLLGPPGAVERAAEAIASLLTQVQSNAK